MSYSATIIQLVKYFIAGFLGLLADLAVYTATFAYSHLQYILSTILAFPVAQVISFIIDRYWTFQNHSKRRKVQFAKFLAVSAIALAMNVSINYLFVSRLGFSPIYAQTASITIIPVISYIGHRYWAFKDEPAPT